MGRNESKSSLKKGIYKTNVHATTLVSDQGKEQTLDAFLDGLKIKEKNINQSARLRDRLYRRIKHDLKTNEIISLAGPRKITLDDLRVVKVDVEHISPFIKGAVPGLKKSEETKKHYRGACEEKSVK